MNATSHPVPAATVPCLSGAEALPLAHALLKHCLLCKSPRVAVVGVFLPDRPALWFAHVRPGYTRGRWYALCRRCLREARRTHAANVEEKFFAMMTTEPRGQDH